MTAPVASGAAQGALFDTQSRLILAGLGFDVNDKPFVVPELGIEIDAVAKNRRGVEVWFEFKGSWLGKRPGGRRTDTVKKALLSAYALHCHPHGYPAFVVLTSHLPKAASRGDLMVRAALECGALADLICVNDPADMERLARWAVAESPAAPAITNEEEM